MPPNQTPIFPLKLVLFPGAPQLLHIFEPRYRRMVADCSEGDHRFGVSFVPGNDERDALIPGAVGCLARVDTIQTLPDGRSNLLVVGEVRYRIVEPVSSETPYHQALVEPFDDESQFDPSLNELCETVRHRFTQLYNLSHFPGEFAGDVLELNEDPKALSFQVAASLGLEPAQAQELLEETSTAARLESLNETMLGLVEEAQARREVQDVARRNGKGRPGSEIETAP